MLGDSSRKIFISAFVATHSNKLTLTEMISKLHQCIVNAPVNKNVKLGLTAIETFCRPEFSASSPIESIGVAPAVAVFIVCRVM